MTQQDIQDIVADILECSAGKRPWPERYFAGVGLCSVDEVITYLKQNKMLDQFIKSPELKNQVKDDTFLLKDSDDAGHAVYRVYYRERGATQVLLATQSLEEGVRYILKIFSFLR